MEILVLSRASLGLGGVLIVAGSVAGGLGLVSAVGFSSTLIVMEVIPFLVLAVGVDNMFIITHALAKQVRLCVHVAGYWCCKSKSTVSCRGAWTSLSFSYFARLHHPNTNRPHMSC